MIYLNRFESYRFATYAPSTGGYHQCFQDLFVCWKLKKKEKGVFVEFGADNGVLNSNSYLLEKKYNWNGILIEPNPTILKELKRNRNCKINNYIITDKTNEIIKFECMKDRQHSRIHKKSKSQNKNSKIFSVNTITLDDLLLKNKINIGFDFLSIDVEGNEIEVLKGFDIKYWHPKIVVIEHNYKKDIMKFISEYFIKSGYKKELNLFSFNDFWFTYD